MASLLSPSSLYELGMPDGFTQPNNTSALMRVRSALTNRIEGEMKQCLGTVIVQKTLQRGINRFNVNPKDGIAFMVEEGLITEEPESLCNLLATVDGLSKRRLGEYFGRDNATAQKVLSLFLKRLKFKNASLDEALRSMVLKFRLPGEAQQMDRIMERFSDRYHEENPGVFSCSDTAWVLSFGLMILNTDMYNRNIKEGDKMTEAQFINNHRGVDRGKDPPKELLEGMYRRVKAAEIRMDEGDMYESEVITFVAPKKSGWLKKKSKGYVGKWKKHWFVLNDAVLYYFIAPQHQDEAPRCIIPLERINIDPIGTTDLTICLQDHNGYVKSVKMMDNGSMERGHHRSFVLRAENLVERDSWVEALRDQVPTQSMDLSSNRSLTATPATSSAPTPIGTPSDSGRRIGHKFGGTRTDRRRRAAALEAALADKMLPPVMRGWARMQSDQHQTGGRRYIALFRGVGMDVKDAMYFFGDAIMCDKMISQRARTHHGCLPLCDVTRVQLRQEDGDDSGTRAIVLQTGVGKDSKELVIVPEDQKEFWSWTRHIKECCPGSAYSIAADGTPMASSIGETAFPSVNTSDSRVEEGLVSAISLSSFADQIGLRDDVMTSNVFVAVAPALASGSGDSKSGGRDGSVDYGRTESSETQPATLLQQEMDRVLTMPSAETEVDSRTEPDTTAPGSPQSPAPDVIRTTRNMREDSTAGTDLE